MNGAPVIQNDCLHHNSSTTVQITISKTIYWSTITNNIILVWYIYIYIDSYLERSRSIMVKKHLNATFVLNSVSMLPVCVYMCLSLFSHVQIMRHSSQTLRCYQSPSLNLHIYTRGNDGCRTIGAVWYSARKALIKAIAITTHHYL